VVISPEMLAKQEALRAHFASDELLVERASVWRDATPQECQAATEEECVATEQFLSQLDPETLERALAPESLPSDVEQILVRLWSQRNR
jgi:hypothetical protein